MPAPASAGEVTAAAAPTIPYVWPYPGSYVRTGVDVTIEVRVAADVDHVVVYDGKTGERLTELTGAPRATWRYVWTASAGSVSPDLEPVSTTGVVGARVRTGYGFDDVPPVVDSLFFQFPGGGGSQVTDRVGPSGTLSYGIQENTWATVDIWSIDGVVIPEMQEGDWSYPPRAEPYLLRIQVMDGAGNWGERTFSLRVDATAPTVTSVVPANGTRVRGSLVHSSLVASDESGINRAHLVGAYEDVTAPYAASVPAGADGPRVLTWRVWDMLGNITTVERTVTVDNTGPVVTWVGPANGALIRGARISSGVTAADPAGVLKAQLSGAVADTSAPYSSTIAAGKDGVRTLTWTVWDRLGNTTVLRRSVTVDNTKAKVAFVKAPKNKAKVKGTVKVTASASDRNGVTRVQLLINGKVVATDLKAAYQFSINTRRYGKKIKIQLRAYDKAGNVTTTSARTWYRN
ncbi:Ig-like domain-containing protein [Actinoplanes subglobosus]|uniref:Ig-like domain-containing protein n=1 Tax=Actinoplanes subglobosus TaxID=1547892 RepID=A0ABV8IS58_9ACTN